MKKLSLAVAVAATLVSGVANAYTVATPDDGVLVPNVIHNGATDTTAVSITNHATTGVTVYWTFFDQNSLHITDGQFTMTGRDMQTFIWSTESGLGLEGQRGYLVFAVGTSAADPTNSGAADQISGAAFQADAVNGDAVFVPTFPIDDADGIAGLNLSTLDATSLANLAAGAAAGDVVDMRYAIDGEFSTAIALWSTGGLNDTFTVNMYDDAQNRKSVNFECAFSELCFVDPSTIVGRPATFTNGYVNFDTSVAGTVNGNLAGDFVSYSAIRSVSYGATQTILNSHY